VILIIFGILNISWKTYYFIDKIYLNIITRVNDTCKNISKRNLDIDDHKINSQWYPRETNELFFDYIPENEEGEYIHQDFENGN